MPGMLITFLLLPVPVVDIGSRSLHSSTRSPITASVYPGSSTPGSFLESVSLGPQAEICLPALAVTALVVDSHFTASSTL